MMLKFTEMNSNSCKFRRVCLKTCHVDDRVILLVKTLFSTWYSVIRQTLICLRTHRLENIF